MKSQKKKTNRAIRHMSKTHGPGETKPRLPGVLAQESHNSVWHHLWSAANQGSSPRPWHPGVLLGVSHVGMWHPCECSQLFRCQQKQSFTMSHTVPAVALCGPMDCSLPGSFIHGILQARVLKWVAMPSSSDSSWPRDQTQVSHISCIGS